MGKSLTGLLTHGTDLPSSGLRQNRKSEGVSDLEAEERGTDSLSCAGKEDTAQSCGCDPCPSEVQRAGARSMGSGVELDRVRLQALPGTCFLITLGEYLTFLSFLICKCQMRTIIHSL